MWHNDRLSDNDIRYANQWKKYASDLGIQVISPFELTHDNKTYIYAICIKHFGNHLAPNGVVGRVEGKEFTSEQCGKIWVAAVENGYAPHNQAIGVIKFSIEDAKQHLDMYLWMGEDRDRPRFHTGQFFSPSQKELEFLESEVVDRKTFLRFVKVLYADKADETRQEAYNPSLSHGAGLKGWEHNTIEDYLEACVASDEDTEINNLEEGVSKNPYRAFARFLYRGKYYE